MTDPTNSVGGDTADLPSTDASSLERLSRFGGGKLLAEMIGLYLTTTPERLKAARAGLALNDASATERELHSLKSSSAQLGALRLQRLCAQGEALARAGSLGPIPSLMNHIEEEFPRVKSWLEQALTQKTA